MGPGACEGGGGLDPEGAEGEFIATSPQGENVLGLKQCPNGLEKHREKMKVWRSLRGEKAQP